MNTISTAEAIKALENNEVIAYPTEGVFGLGCDPDSATAIKTIDLLKNRPENKGYILLGNKIQDFDKYIDWSSIDNEKIKIIEESIDKHTTWLVHCRKLVNKKISGNTNKIAIRLTNHDVIKSICFKFKKPIVSTSANISSQTAALTHNKLKEYFGDKIKCVNGSLGNKRKPSIIIDLETNKKIR